MRLKTHMCKAMYIDRVSKFKYLRVWTFERRTSDIEIKNRIEQARQAFLRQKSI